MSNGRKRLDNRARQERVHPQRHTTVSVVKYIVATVSLDSALLILFIFHSISYHLYPGEQTNFGSQADNSGIVECFLTETLKEEENDLLEHVGEVDDTNFRHYINGQ